MAAVPSVSPNLPSICLNHIPALLAMFTGIRNALFGRPAEEDHVRDDLRTSERLRVEQVANHEASLAAFRASLAELTDALGPRAASAQRPKTPKTEAKRRRPSESKADSEWLPSKEPECYLDESDPPMHRAAGPSARRPAAPALVTDRCMRSGCGEPRHAKEGGGLHGYCGFACANHDGAFDAARPAKRQRRATGTGGSRFACHAAAQQRAGGGAAGGAGAVSL